MKRDLIASFKMSLVEEMIEDYFKKTNQIHEKDFIDMIRLEIDGDTLILNFNLLETTVH